MSGFAVIARTIHILLLGLWSGAGLLLMFSVAPGAFQMLSSRQEAGALVGAVIAQIDLCGLFAGPVLLVTLFAGWMPLQARLRARALSILAMTAAVAISGQWLSPRMHELKQAMGRTIQDVDPSDPLRAQFDTYHTASEWLMVLHVALALAMLIVAAVRSGRKSSSFGAIEL